MGMIGVLQPEKGLNGTLSQVYAPNIQAISIVENGEYRAPNGVAYNPITVDVPTFEPQGNIEIIENGDYSVYDYEIATINVPGLVPSGTFSVTENGSYDITEYAGVDVDVEPSLQSKSRTYTPLKSAQTETITADGAYDGLNEVNVTVVAIQTETKTATPREQSQQVVPSTGKYLTEVTVEAVDSHYVGSAINRRTDVDVTADGAAVSVPNGYYAVGVTKNVQAGAEGVPQVVLGAVTNHSIEVTPTVTNIEGYIAGSTKTGSSATITANDLVSGTEDISENGVYDITNKASVNVTVSQPSGTKEISIIHNGVVTEDVEWYEDAELSVNVPNTYTQVDEGKVVNNGALVGQTSRNITANGTIDTTLNNEVVVAVPNTYTQADEGKVVNSGALVSQTSRTVSDNGTYDTTTNNQIVVNVEASLPAAEGGDY